ncbi:hypothetical protein ACIO3R_32125 [Streptomyces sp. NPDC087428]|uniref:hypothetical protein n=1 Tax=Streptomyces sp. NPDC087428 TaxID=3365788 RepID=UPI0038025528
MIVEVGSRRAAVLLDELTARYVGTQKLDRHVRAGQIAVDPLPVRAVVEIKRQQGGMSPRALLGAGFAPTDGADVHCIVPVSDDPLSLGRQAVCRSTLGRPIVAGLPEEFAIAAADSLGAAATSLSLPPGILTVDRAGYDEVESSEHIFAAAAQLLCHVIHAQLRGLDTEQIPRELVESWL